MTTKTDFQAMFNNGIHIGHRKHKWNPRMKVGVDLGPLAKFHGSDALAQDIEKSSEIALGSAKRLEAFHAVKLHAGRGGPGKAHWDPPRQP